MAKKAIEDLELDVDEVLLMELIDYASKRGTVRAVQDLVAKALAEAKKSGPGFITWNTLESLLHDLAYP